MNTKTPGSRKWRSIISIMIVIAAFFLGLGIFQALSMQGVNQSNIGEGAAGANPSGAANAPSFTQQNQEAIDQWTASNTGKLATSQQVLVHSIGIATKLLQGQVPADKELSDAEDLVTNSVAASRLKWGGLTDDQNGITDAMNTSMNVFSSYPSALNDINGSYDILAGGIQSSRLSWDEFTSTLTATLPGLYMIGVPFNKATSSLAAYTNALPGTPQDAADTWKVVTEAMADPREAAYLKRNGVNGFQKAIEDKDPIEALEALGKSLASLPHETAVNLGNQMGLKTGAL